MPSPYYERDERCLACKHNLRHTARDHRRHLASVPKVKRLSDGLASDDPILGAKADPEGWARRVAADKPEFKTNAENKAELLAEARQMTKRDIRVALRQRGALHNWAVEAYEQALSEKGGR